MSDNGGYRSVPRRDPGLKPVRKVSPKSAPTRGIMSNWALRLAA
jgi:hypothetical protein